MNQNKKFYKSFMEYQDKYFNEYSQMEQDYIRKHIFDSSEYSYVDIVAQILSKIGYLNKDRDRYLGFVDMIINEFRDKSNILEVACGRYPIVSYHLSKLMNTQVNITAMDPKLVVSNIDGIKLIKDSFTGEVEVSSYDLGVAYFPCACTEEFVRKFCTEEKDFILGLCGCTTHFPTDKFSLYRTYSEDEWFDYILSVVEESKKDNCKVLVKSLSSNYNCNYPIVIGKHER